MDPRLNWYRWVVLWCMVSLLGGCECATFRVTSSSSSGGSCPGPQCTLAAAWKVVKLNDTILLTVNATLEERLDNAMAPWQTSYPSTLTIAASRPGLSVSPSPNRVGYMQFMALALLREPIRVILDGFSISGFNASSNVWSKRQKRDLPGILCIAQYGGCMGLAPELDLGPKGGNVWGRVPDAQGGTPQPHPSVLTMQNMDFSNNHYTQLQRYGHPYTIYGLIIVSCFYNCSVVLAHTTINNNTMMMDRNMHGDLVSLIFNENVEPSVSLFIDEVEVSGNELIWPPLTYPFHPYDALFFSLGRIYATGLKVVGNTMGQGLGILSTGMIPYFNHHHGGDVYLQNSEFRENRLPKGGHSEGTWTIVAQNAYISNNVLIESAAPRAVWTRGDQYFSSVAFTTPDGSPSLLSGSRFYDRDPLPRSLLATHNSTSSFANCTESAPWPCPAIAPTCTNVVQQGLAVGYCCSTPGSGKCKGARF